MQKLNCAKCNKDMGVLRDARIRTGMVVYCRECDALVQQAFMQLAKNLEGRTEMPDFLKGLFR